MALFTTDCMSAAGAPPGRYRLADTEVEVGPDRIVRKPGETCFAGSSLAPDEGVENLKRWLGLDPEKARALFSTRVAEPSKSNFQIRPGELEPHHAERRAPPSSAKLLPVM